MTLDAHSSRGVPLLRYAMDPSDIEWVWAVWSEKIGTAAIESSTWVLPAGWDAEAYQMDAELTVGGDTYAKANGALVNPNGAARGKYRITNRITLAGGRQLERSLDVWVRDL